MDDLLRVPVGRDENGDLVGIAHAVDFVSYACPECAGRLILREGEIKQRHFAHYRQPENCALIGEGWKHIAAKFAVAAVVEDWLCGRGPRPTIERRCEWCHRSLRTQPLPETVKRAILERPMDTIGVRPDVTLVDAEGKSLCGIEIFNTHAVDGEKRGRLVGVPWIELLADDVLNKPSEWKPVQDGGLKPYECACQIGRRDETCAVEENLNRSSFVSFPRAVKQYGYSFKLSDGNWLIALHPGGEMTCTDFCPQKTDWYHGSTSASIETCQDACEWYREGVDLRGHPDYKIPEWPYSPTHVLCRGGDPIEPKMGLKLRQWGRY